MTVTVDFQYTTIWSSTPLVAINSKDKRSWLLRGDGQGIFKICRDLLW